MCGCLSLCFGPGMSWPLVQGGARLSPQGSWERLQPPPPPGKGEKSACKMDRYVRFVLVVGIGELRVDAMPLQRVMRVNPASIASVQSELFYLLWRLFK